MILPKQIKTRNKIRDAKICYLSHDGLQNTEIAQQFGLSRQRVGVILYSNREFLKETIDWAKIKRVHHLNRFMNQIPDDLHPKNIDEAIKVLDLHRKEFDGDDSQIEVHNHFTLISPPENLAVDSRVSQVEL